MVVGLGIECIGLFFLFVWQGGFLLAFFCLFHLATVKYTFSLNSMLMKWQDKNCFMCLINFEDRKSV